MMDGLPIEIRIHFLDKNRVGSFDGFIGHSARVLGNRIIV